MEGWRTVPLGELVDQSRGISYGIVQPGENVSEGVPIVRVSDLRGDRLSADNPMRVLSEIEASYSRTRLRGGELIMSIVGTVGQTAIVDSSHVGWNVARAIAVIPVRDEIGAYWIRLSLRGGPARNHINKRLNTTVQATLNLRDLATLPIPMPPDSERRAIAAILSALDDKIELNRRMNETLEAMARAIFKDWFVDFGQTRAKIEGRAPYLAPDIWSLFPDRLDEEGKPEGWGIFRLSELAMLHTQTTTPSAAPDIEFEHFSLPAYDSGRSPAIDRGVTIKSNKTVMPDGPILLSKLNPEIERVWIPEAASGLPQICSTEFLVFTPSEISTQALLFGLFTEISFRSMLQSMVTGTSKSHQRISPSSLLQRDVLVGEEALFARYGESIGGALKRVLSNRKESRTLAATRDLLLPKLMSGEIRVKDAEEIVEGVL